MNALEIQGLSKTYRGKKWKPVTALINLDLCIEEGEVFGFLGPNGSGKSTTIKSVMGLITPTAGSICLYGKSSSNPNARKCIGYLPENPSFYEYLTAWEYLRFVGGAFGMNEADVVSEGERVLKLLDLDDAAKRPIRGYSKGMVQRLGLAQAMLHDPDIYILDEPMSGLDPIGRSLVKEIIIDLKKRGKTVFFSTHITSDVESVCDRVGIIVGGKLRTVQNVENLLEKGIEGYLVRVRNCRDSIFQGMEYRIQQENVYEVHVPKKSLAGFMQGVGQVDAEITLIEPKRRDLEAFFLEIVEKSSK